MIMSIALAAFCRFMGPMEGQVRATLARKSSIAHHTASHHMAARHSPPVVHDAHRASSVPTKPSTPHYDGHGSWYNGHGKGDKQGGRARQPRHTPRHALCGDAVVPPHLRGGRIRVTSDARSQQPLRVTAGDFTWCQWSHGPASPVELIPLAQP
jgi:hypothetical protein